MAQRCFALLLFKFFYYFAFFSNNLYNIPSFRYYNKLIIKRYIIKYYINSTVLIPKTFVFIYIKYFL